MNKWWYAWLVEKRFVKWARAGFGDDRQVSLVQDHERALWTEEARAAMRRAGIALLEQYPKCSQDLNPIEVCWRELRSRLYDTMPTYLEKREDFIARVHNAVAWLNRNRADYFLYLSSCQKEWARDVKNASPPGARTKH